MKKSVPLVKEIKFDTNVAEITAISLDHDLYLENNTIVGNLVISGSYKMNDISINTEGFSHKIPVNIEVGTHYDLTNLIIDIDDFYYEVIDSKILKVSIEVGLSNISEKIIQPDDKFEEIFKEEIKEEENYSRMEISDVKTLFDSFDDDTETYATYKVYIVKENDNIESICLNYEIDKENIELYNDLSELKIGDKVIIPNKND